MITDTSIENADFLLDWQKKAIIDNLSQASPDRKWAEEVGKSMAEEILKALTGKGFESLSAVEMTKVEHTIAHIVKEKTWD
jgi:hypothetical protein